MFSGILLNEKSKMHTWMYKTSVFGGVGSGKRQKLSMCIFVYYVYMSGVQRGVNLSSLGCFGWRGERWGCWKTLVTLRGSCDVVRVCWQGELCGWSAGCRVRLCFGPALPFTSRVTVRVWQCMWNTSCVPRCPRILWDGGEDAATAPWKLLC